MEIQFEICQFCEKLCRVNHLCAKRFMFENFFKHFFMSILFDFKPKNGLEFWNITINLIQVNNLFNSSPNPREVVLENLIHFITMYDCF